MVARGMKRYRQRDAEQAALIGPGGWSRLDGETLFDRQAPWRLELGFGHGDFLSALAAAHPAVDHLGVEHNELRVTKTAHKCRKQGLANVRVFGGDAQAFVRFRLPAASLERVYILFSDPWPKRKHRRRRLINRALLLDLAWALAPTGGLIIASDCHEYALSVLSHSTTLPGLYHHRYQSGYRFDIPTRFTTVFQRHKQAAGERICYLHLERSAQMPPRRVPMGNGLDQAGEPDLGPWPGSACQPTVMA